MGSPLEQLPFRRVGEVQLMSVLQDSPYILACSGYQHNLERRVFIKLLKPHLAGEHHLVRRFHKEGQICANLQHPGIVRVFQLGQEQEYHFIIQEFVEGKSLQDLLRDSHPLPDGVIGEMLLQTLAGLGYAHGKGVIHRDIKPANLLLARDGQVKIADFGLARILDRPEITHQDAVVGSPAYMAPEQITGEGVSPATDLFALGVSAYQLFSGVSPFAGEDLTQTLHKVLNQSPQPLVELRPDLPAELCQWVEMLMHKNSAARPGESAVAAAELEKILSARFPDSGSTVLKDFAETLKVAPFEIPAEIAPPAGETGIPAQTSRGRWWKWAGAPAAIAILLAAYFLIPQAGEPARLAAIISSEKDSLVNATVADSPGDILPERAFGAQRDSGSAPRPAEEKPAESPLQSPVTRQPQPEPEVAAEQIPTGLAPDSQISVTGVGRARLTVVLEPAGDVYLNRQRVGQNSGRRVLELEAGAYLLEFRHPRFPASLQEITLDPGEERQINWSFLSTVGFVNIGAKPWADIYIDDVFREQTPITRPIMLPVGEHLIELKHPELGIQRRVVEIAAGDTVLLQVSMKAEKLP